ncbi:MAG: arginine--tRNA ligase [Pseudomonadota bacterium]
MNLFEDLTQFVQSAVKAIDGIEAIDPKLVSRIVVEPPRDPSHGDMSTNAAMVLAKPLGSKPRDIAEIVAAALKSDPRTQSVDIAGPGFINFTLLPEAWQAVVGAAVEADKRFGAQPIGEYRVNVEYVSANPTGPLHIGHCRGAVYGDALANLLAFTGQDIVKEYYVNDAGAQVDVLAKSAFLRYREALGQDIGDIPEGLYPGDYLKPVGQTMADEFGDDLVAKDEAEWLPIVRGRAMEAMMDMIRADLATLGVEQDVFFSEKSLHQPIVSGGNETPVSRSIEELRARDLVYEGTLPPPKGQLPEDWEDREQTLMRTTQVGDDIDRPLMKSDGSYTYFASDVAYFADKFSRNFDETVYVLGADHGGYVKRLEAVAKAVSGGKTQMNVKLCQLVKLFRNGEPVTMSKRAGTFITLRDVVEEVGADAVRFMMLYRRNDAPLDFDFAKVTEQSKDNPVFYVQYGHARCASLFRQAAADMPDFAVGEMARADLSLLVDAGEADLMRKVGEWPRVVAAAARAQEPHRIAFYLYELASLLHSHWSRGKETPELRFINANKRELSLARLALVKGVQNVLAAGLGIVGASAPNEMR